MSQRQSTGSTESTSSSTDSSSSTSEDDFNNRAVAVAVNDWLLETLLEHLYSSYDPDDQSPLHKQVYRLLKDQLSKIKIDYTVASFEDLTSIRRKCSADFNELVKDALTMFEQQEVSFTLSADIQQRVDTLLQSWNSPTRLMIPRLLDGVTLYTSRFRDEFAEKDQLGKGGYGMVFNAKYKLDNCHYAVKKIYVCDTDVSDWTQTLREVYALAKLSHMHVVRYYGVWFEHNSPFTAATEPSSEMNIGSASSDGGVVFADGSDGNCVDGNNVTHLLESEASPKGPSDSGDSGINSNNGSWSLSERTIMKNANVVLHIQMELCTKTLADWLDERNRQPVPSGENVYTVVKENESELKMREILEGIEYIHGQNIIHRDLKPENIFLVAGNGDEFHVKIGDFGLSREDTKNMPNPSQQGAMSGAGDYTSDIGTKSYAAPEQLETSSYSTKVDMFSVGLIMFELYQPFSTYMDKSKSFDSIRNCRQLPEEFAEKWPDQAACIEELVRDADERPTAEEIIRTHKKLFQKKENENLKKENEKLKKENLLQTEKIKRQKETITQQVDKISQQKEQISQQLQQISQQEEQISQQQQQQISQQEEQI